MWRRLEGNLGREDSLVADVSFVEPVERVVELQLGGVAAHVPIHAGVEMPVLVSTSRDRGEVTISLYERGVRVAWEEGRVTAVEPGPFRTDWAGRSMRRTQRPLPDYADTVGARIDGFLEGVNAHKNWTFPFDPADAGFSLIDVTITNATTVSRISAPVRCTNEAGSSCA